ncbi:YrhC family protein [Bacillus sp. NPDC077027]|uniref:YrhC family protein n=1 Tax=Bacillus sp. NPDC077027 TaxID=3390548 RepID=UPI003CFC68E1
MKKKWSGLMTDYKQYAFILLAVSTFLYIGTILPAQHIEGVQKTLMIGVNCLFLIAAFGCVKRSLFYRKKLQELDEDLS